MLQKKINILQENKGQKFEELYMTHKYTMLHTSHKILNDWNLAEDAVHNAFMKMFNKIDTISDISCNKTRNLMVIIVRNVSIDMYNKKMKNIEYGYDDLQPELVSKDAQVEDLVISKNSINDVAKYISKLEKKYSDVLMLKYSFGYIDMEISQLLGISNENVRVRLHRGRNALKNLMNEVCIDE